MSKVGGGGNVSGGGKTSFGGGVGGAKCNTTATKNDAAKTTTLTKSCGIEGFKSKQGIDAGKFSADKLNNKLVSNKAEKVSLPSPKTPVTPVKATVTPSPVKVAPNSAYKPVNLDSFLDPKKGSNAVAAIVVGNAEGNRTPTGGFTKNYNKHTDPGDKKTNLGSFSYNPRGSGKVAKTPQEADRIYLGELKNRKNNYEKKVKAAGIDPNNSLLASTYFDAATQAPRAANKMLNQIDYVKKNGITTDTMKEWRVRGYVDVNTGQRWTYPVKDSNGNPVVDKNGNPKIVYAGSGFAKAGMSEADIQAKISNDQKRRADAIIQALDAQGLNLNTP